MSVFIPDVMSRCTIARMKCSEALEAKVSPPEIPFKGNVQHFEDTWGSCASDSILNLFVTVPGVDTSQGLSLPDGDLQSEPSRGSTAETVARRVSFGALDGVLLEQSVRDINQYQTAYIKHEAKSQAHHSSGAFIGTPCPCRHTVLYLHGLLCFTVGPACCLSHRGNVACSISIIFSQPQCMIIT